MSDMLSQEEIDALLRGDSGPSQPNSSSTEQILSDEEKDALGEIGNISMGTSATTLYTLLNQKVNITTPRVTVLTWEELSSQYPVPYVAVQVEYKEGLVGSNLLIMKEDDVKIITDLMMGGPGQTNSEPITDLHLSAISEAMNQMIGSSSTSLASMFNKRIDISPPKAFSMFFNDPAIADKFLADDMVVKIAFRMEIGDIIDSEIMQLLPIDFAKSLVDNLFGNMAQPEEKPQPVQPKAAPAPTPTPIPTAKPQAQPQIQTHSGQIEGDYNRQQAYQEQHRPSSPQREEARMVNVQPIQYQSFDSDQWAAEKESIDLIKDIPLEVTVELGRTKKLIKDILEFGPGTILELDKLAGEPVDILVNGKYIAKGEVVVIDESFGVRITDIISASKRLTKLQ
ncbi:MAG: flagellar motor switch protein FliN [Clostridia bacterium]|jgi:flagellar motor switch protein FliN/FliY|nr:flagellar motor switch protein FliN [Clostridia bacterium]